MTTHKTVPNVYGPGAFTDTSYTALPDECRRLLHHFAKSSPVFTTSKDVLDDVQFQGGEFPIIPGPVKSQAVAAVCHAMIGIVGKEICALKGIDTGKVIIDVDKAALCPATVAIANINGKDMPEIKHDSLAFKAGTDLDQGSFDLTLTAGKRTLSLDLTVQEDKDHLRALIEDADVIVQVYRYRSLERKGFGLDEVLEMPNKRGKGIVYLDLNCYGPDGYYAERPVYQQIADAASGCSYIMGQANGFEAGVGVLPSLPKADMLSGAIGVVDVMPALRDRAKVGGSYHAHVALKSIDTAQIDKEVGLYSPDVVAKIQETLKFAPMTPELHVEELLGVVVGAWKANSNLLDRDGYMATFKTAFGERHSILSPIVQFENGSANPHWPQGPVPYCQNRSLAWA
ncbi:alpha methylacyl- racemase protein [Purpureocillium lavendulum]|uniref:Alpha methylacyl- racemase protein n=1 Tax=Purpureocillium lavendulum TaxID=1247861 RepID=A0AB34FSG6_9HYPO|nr:alpha methylacyl- racemase protein [Purpureocillium lavendulum]